MHIPNTLLLRLVIEDENMILTMEEMEETA